MAARPRTLLSRKQQATPSVIHPVPPSAHSLRLPKNRIQRRQSWCLQPQRNRAQLGGQELHSRRMTPVAASCVRRLLSMMTGRIGDFVQKSEGRRTTAGLVPAVVNRNGPWWWGNRDEKIPLPLCARSLRSGGNSMTRTVEMCCEALCRENRLMVEE